MNVNRTQAAEQFADAADEANRNGCILCAHSNTAYSVMLPDGEMQWFHPDEDGGGLLGFVQTKIEQAKAGAA